MAKDDNDVRRGELNEAEITFGRSSNSTSVGVNEAGEAQSDIGGVVGHPIKDVALPFVYVTTIAATGDTYGFERGTHRTLVVYKYQPLLARWEHYADIHEDLIPHLLPSFHAIDNSGKVFRAVSAKESEYEKAVRDYEVSVGIAKSKPSATTESGILGAFVKNRRHRSF